MRAAVTLGLLIAIGTGVGFTLDPAEPLTAAGAIVLMGMAVCMILTGIAMGVYELIAVTIRGL